MRFFERPRRHYSLVASGSDNQRKNEQRKTSNKRRVSNKRQTCSKQHRVVGVQAIHSLRYVTAMVMATRALSADTDSSSFH